MITGSSIRQNFAFLAKKTEESHCGLDSIAEFISGSILVVLVSLCHKDHSAVGYRRMLTSYEL